MRLWSCWLPMNRGGGGWEQRLIDGSGIHRDAQKLIGELGSPSAHWTFENRVSFRPLDRVPPNLDLGLGLVARSC